MNASVLLACATAGFVYGITPGPGVLAVLGIGAARGRPASAAFLAGHLAGDVVWSTVALVAIIGVQAIGHVVFDILGLVSGAYLFWLGVRAIRARQAGAEASGLPLRRPLLHGVVFGLTNPKAYPVAVATFTALLSGHASELSWGMLPLLVAAGLAGGLAAYVILVAAVGAGSVRRFHGRHARLLTRASGVLFVGFAVNAVAHSAPGLWARTR